ncbi:MULTISPECIES: FtsK/SpoIIIE domain-containing protein [Microbacterium]|uniref:FtsK/SpoIIIE domain-containing protein n=1 Tax=Microbacterium TaxID=33882 RepID=UPI0010F5DB6D|nr:FtsK/SpoIIIE domain-containing protein [Microbacterium sp. 4NA327F11]MCK9917589.1 cell division protein FtsK [Microbacteriaceae bacterium K1510]
MSGTPPTLAPLPVAVRLPATPDSPRRPGIPMFAAIAPVAGAVGMWLLTGSVAMLWFAALGPLIAGATLLDGARTRRRERRAASRSFEAELTRAAAEIAGRHDDERRRLRAVHPDVATIAASPDEIWRIVPGRAARVTVGRGSIPSAVPVDGGAGDPRVEELRHAAAVLDDATVTVPVDAGIAVVGPRVAASAVVRALAAQLVLTRPPGELRVVVPRRDAHPWADALPHRRATEGATLALLEPGDMPPGEARMLIARVDDGAPPPPWCAAVITLDGALHGRVDYAGSTLHIVPEALGADQAREIGNLLRERGRAILGAGDATETVPLAALVDRGRPPRPGTLEVAFAATRAGAMPVDLVADGPHALVIGVTGSGKSELLISWVTALALHHTPAEVTFLLADFKGGTAFDALAALPHTAGVITDLDGVGARRAIESLRAEIRTREAVLARAGVRDIRDADGLLARLVIVVDEFAALLDAHPELAAVFTDIAARGRALGMHLVLGTQRASGTVRDGLLANVPLRLALRVTDPHDSRWVIGDDAAAALPGDLASRGLAFVRRPSDVAPVRVRVALTAREDIAAAAEADTCEVRPPWLPPLPARVPLRSLDRAGLAPRTVLLGVRDEPERQRRTTAVLAPHDRGLLVVGGSRSGKSALLAVVAAQVPAASLVALPDDPERLWDALVRLDEQGMPRRGVLLLDDLDAVVARFPADYGAVVQTRLERVVRSLGDGDARAVVTTQRVSGAAARIAELLPHRAVLALPGRSDHVAAGAASSSFSATRPPGRAVWGDHEVQFALAADAHDAPSAPDERDAESADAPIWRPTMPLAGVVVRGARATRGLREALRGHGLAVHTVAEVVAESGRLDDDTTGRVVIVGDADDWQRAWAVLGRVRGHGELVIDAGHGGEYRLLSGERDLPPYWRSPRGRGWRLADGEVTRVTLPGVLC